jgi:hypothetical protein
VLARWDKLTIGVHNAGIGLWADAEAMTVKEWVRVIRRPAGAAWCSTDLVL